MTKKAWYLGCSADDVADRVILIGDPGRVPRLSQYLQDVRLLPVNRGLATATGTYEGVGITLAAFGMGAPIAAIVMHELSELGCRTFLRIGTTMCLPPVTIGDLVIAENALRHEGTSQAYAPPDFAANADPGLVTALSEAATKSGNAHHVGRFASFDGFYRDMFALDDNTATRVRANFDSLSEQGVIAVDMETSALLTIGRVLGRRAAALCVTSVNAHTQQKLPRDEFAKRERQLITTALSALRDLPDSK